VNQTIPTPTPRKYARKNSHYFEFDFQYECPDGLVSEIKTVVKLSLLTCMKSEDISFWHFIVYGGGFCSGFAQPSLLVTHAHGRHGGTVLTANLVWLFIRTMCQNRRSYYRSPNPMSRGNTFISWSRGQSQNSAGVGLCTLVSAGFFYFWLGNSALISCIHLLLACSAFCAVFYRLYSPH